MKKKDVFIMKSYSKNIIPLLFSITTVLAPSLMSDEYAKQVVLEMYPKWYSGEDVTIQGNVGIEKIFRGNDWIQYYGKPSLTYALNKNWALHGGLGYYYTAYQNVNDTYEIRPFLGISHSSKWTDKWTTGTYFRTEERYHYSTGSNNRSNNTRLRLRIRTSYLFNPVTIPNRWHKVTFGIEGFKSYNTDNSLEKLYDYQTNITLGLERSLQRGQKLRFELAWKYKAALNQITDTDISTAFFKIQYYPSWGRWWRNKLRNRDIDE